MSDTIRPPTFEDRLDRDDRDFDDDLRERLKLAFERDVDKTQDTYGFEDARARAFVLEARPPRLIDHLLRELAGVDPHDPDVAASASASASTFHH